MRPPERPADVERLWREGQPLSPDELPDWLEPEDAWYYRRVAGVSTEQIAAEQREQLEVAGLVLDPTGVYVPDPTEPIWSIGIYRGPSPFELTPAVEGPVLTRDDVTDVTASYIADPFLLRAGGTWHMFFEVYNWRANKGEIGLATSKDGLQWQYGEIVLAEEFHLSYPYVFEWAGERYLVPESHQAGEVRLYRADPFPTGWSLVGTLLEGSAFADPSVFSYQDRWWLLVEASPELAHDTLRLYLAADLEGPWTEHPRSPVIRRDPMRARPAGRVLVDAGRIVRFSQDCSQFYGAAVRAFEITELTTRTYVEHELAEQPLLAGSGAGWNAGGMHHIDARPHPEGGWIAAVDGWAHGGSDQ